MTEHARDPRPGTRPLGVVCDDRVAVRRRLGRQLEHVGIELAGEADAFVPLLKLVLRSNPDVAVLTLPLVGTSGMTAVKALRAASPDCELVVLSALGSLEVAAHEAGALAVLSEDDPRALSQVLTALVRRSTTPTPPQPGPPAAEDCIASAGSSTTKPPS